MQMTHSVLMPRAVTCAGSGTSLTSGAEGSDGVDTEDEGAAPAAAAIFFSLFSFTSCETKHAVILMVLLVNFHTFSI